MQGDPRRQVPAALGLRSATCARHGVLRGQIDISARLIWLFEKAGWVRDVRWPAASRIEAKRVRAA